MCATICAGPLLGAPQPAFLKRAEGYEGLRRPLPRSRPVKPDFVLICPLSRRERVGVREDFGSSRACSSTQAAEA